MKVIAVSGVPGTGKTTLSKKLADKLTFYYLDVNKLISKHKLAEGYDKKSKTKIVDIKKLNNKLVAELKRIKFLEKLNGTAIKKISGVIIDSHLSHYLPRRYADFCIVTKCGIKELNNRLKKKKFNKEKIQENLQAEIFDVCHNEALQNKHNVILVDTTKGFNISPLARKLNPKC